MNELVEVRGLEKLVSSAVLKFPANGFNERELGPISR